MYTDNPSSSQSVSVSGEGLTHECFRMFRASWMRLSDLSRVHCFSRMHFHVQCNVSWIGCIQTMPFHKINHGKVTQTLYTVAKCPCPLPFVSFMRGLVFLVLFSMVVLVVVWVTQRWSWRGRSIHTSIVNSPPYFAWTQIRGDTVAALHGGL